MGSRTWSLERCSLGRRQSTLLLGHWKGHCGILEELALDVDDLFGKQVTRTEIPEEEINIKLGFGVLNVLLYGCWERDVATPGFDALGGFAD